MEISLIQLISDQTMPNLLAPLAFRAAAVKEPLELVHLVTPHSARRSDDIARAAKQAQMNPTLSTEMLSAMPDIEETGRAVAQAVKQARETGRLPVVNYTGATKLMSIGAFEAARELGVPSLYVDTDRELFLDGNTGPRIDSLLGGVTFQKVGKLLNVNIIAVANGSEQVTNSRDAKPFLAFASHLLADSAAERACFNAIRDKTGLCPNGEPKHAAGWLALLERDIKLPAADDAIAAGLVRPSGKGGFRIAVDDGTRKRLVELTHGPRHDGDYRKRYAKAIGPIQFVVGFLAGGWLEVAVWDAAKQSKRFRDVRWSVDIGGKGFGEHLEEDVVAVDGVRIAYFSCKRGGAKAKLATTLEEIDARARRLGGSFTRRFLCLYVPQPPPAVERRAKELDIRIVTAHQLATPGVFDPVGAVAGDG